jgi:ketosteroid isomerase-like protein
MFDHYAAPLAAIAFVAATPVIVQQSPQAVLDELLATERSLSEAAAKLSPAEGIASLIAADGVLMTPKGPVTGPAAAVESLRANPANSGKFAHWRPIRGGLSADGQHGFTMGYLEIEGGKPERDKRRYLAYWVKGSDGWRVAALKQALQAKDEVIVPMQAAALPSRLVAPDPGRTAEHKTSLVAAEKAFSDRAQIVGNHQAFQEYGREDAIHIFGRTGFRVGLKAIGDPDGQPVPPPGPSPVHWSASQAFVASSGDLGVNIGEISQNNPTADAPAANPFFTIWRRDSVDQPWKYIAE